MAADDRHGCAGRDHPRAFDPALGSPPAQGEDHLEHGAQVPDGGEAGAQGDAGIADPGEHRPRIGFDRLVAIITAGISGQMDMGVDQAGQDGAVRQVDQPGARGSRLEGRQ
jgi:hypothetical protein